MGSHINKDGKFQSDKYPTCPPGKVPLSIEDPTAQDLLYEYAQRRREVDAEFADDLEKCLERAGYDAEYFNYYIWRAWFQMGEHQLGRACGRLAKDLNEERPRLVTASFMRWLAGEEVLGQGLLCRRYPKSPFSSIIGHLVHLSDDSLHSLHEMLQHVGYNHTEARMLTQAFSLMFPHVPEYSHKDIISMHSSAIFSAVYSHKTVSDADLRQDVIAIVGERFDDAHYMKVLEESKGRWIRQDERGDWVYFERTARSTNETVDKSTPLEGETLGQFRARVGLRGEGTAAAMSLVWRSGQWVKSAMNNEE